MFGMEVELKTEGPSLGRELRGRSPQSATRPREAGRRGAPADPTTTSYPPPGKQMLQMKKHQRRQKQTLKWTLQRKKLQEQMSRQKKLDKLNKK